MKPFHDNNRFQNLLIGIRIYSGPEAEHQAGSVGDVLDAGVLARAGRRVDIPESFRKR